MFRQLITPMLILSRGMTVHWESDCNIIHNGKRSLLSYFEYRNREISRVAAGEWRDTRDTTIIIRTNGETVTGNRAYNTQH